MRKKENSEDQYKKKHKKQAIFMNIVGIVCFALLIVLGYVIAGWFLKR